MEPTNKQRAERARTVLAAYAEPGTSLSENAADLVCDLLHLLRREAGLDTDEARHDWLMDRLAANEEEITEDQEG